MLSGEGAYLFRGQEHSSVFCLLMHREDFAGHGIVFVCTSADNVIAGNFVILMTGFAGL